MHGVLSCYDRIVITGTLPGICYAAGMTRFLNAKGFRIFDYARFAEPLPPAPEFRNPTAHMPLMQCSSPSPARLRAVMKCA